METDFVFECKKCRHRAFTTKVKKLIGTDCPGCGSEWSGNWIFLRMGSYENEVSK